MCQTDGISLLCACRAEAAAQSFPLTRLTWALDPGMMTDPQKAPPPQSSTWGLVLAYGFWWDTSTQIRQLQHVLSPLSTSAQPRTSLHLTKKQLSFFTPIPSGPSPWSDGFFHPHSVKVLTTKHRTVSSFLTSFYYGDNWKPRLPTSQWRWRLSELPLPPSLPTTMTRISIGSISPLFSSIMFTNITIITILSLMVYLLKALSYS